MQSRKKQIKNKNKRNKGHTFKNKKARGGVTPDGSAEERVVGEVKQSGEQPVIESTKNKIPLLVATKKGCKLHLEADTEKLTFWYSFADGSDDTKHVIATNDDEFSEAIILLDTAVKEKLDAKSLSTVSETVSQEKSGEPAGPAAVEESVPASEEKSGEPAGPAAVEESVPASEEKSGEPVGPVAVEESVPASEEKSGEPEPIESRFKIGDKVFCEVYKDSPNQGIFTIDNIFKSPNGEIQLDGKDKNGTKRAFAEALCKLHTAPAAVEQVNP
uniref:Uncharacterized protein n=1 Tax=viral metagenome TaxID=1070528 RepID=A0A6C0F461_9ZZZZ